MICVKCKKEIPAESIYCMYCGKKQISESKKYHKRDHGTGTIIKDKRNKKPWVAIAPQQGFHTSTRKYIGSFATRAEASAALDDFIKNGRPDYYNATFEDVYKLWSDQHFKNITESGANGYKSMWKWFEPLYSVKMSDLRTADYQTVIDAAKSAPTANKLLSLCSMINTYAMENDIIEKDYSEYVKIPKFDKKEKKPFSKDDIKKLWEHSDDLNVQTVLIMIYTGFRISEIRNLKKSDIHYDDGYMIGGEKTDAGKNRTVPFPPNIPEIMDFVKNQCTRYDGTTLFPISDATFRRTVFNPALESAGIKGDYSPHSTRHTFATLSSASGIAPENLQKIIGHSDYSTTANIYIHTDIDKLKTEMGKITK